MTSKELRQKFLSFFEKKGHKIVPSSSLIPIDPSVLFTTAGMQQFKPYYLGEKSPYGSNVASCQKCVRTSDIEEVGNTPRHLTFLEMLGNFSFGGYFKKEAIKFAFDFLFNELKLPIKDAVFTVFQGDNEVPPDEESMKIWQDLGIPKEKIKKCGREDNFWGPTGAEGPCGPTTEIHIKGTEIWNLVFNEYYQDKNKKLTPLKQKGVDTGMGLERLAMIVQSKNSVYETGLFLPIMSEIRKMTGIKEIKGAFPSEYWWQPLIALEEDMSKFYKEVEHLKYVRSWRIIADHIKSSIFLISEDIFPSNVERGYVLRRILRRAIRYGKLLNLPKNFLIPLSKKVIEIYKDIYPEVKSKEADILTVIQNEEEKFVRTLEKGLKEFKLQIANCKLKKLKEISGKIAFDLYQSYGFPLELTKEMAREENFRIGEKEFEKEFEKHQEISRAGVEKKFGGVGKEAGYESAKLHTATHLLHAALRKVLGEHVKQMGSDITPQRLRFDFSHPARMMEEELRKVENLVNQKIKQDLEVKKEEMNYSDALNSGALAFFKEKYPERVSVYTIGNFSKEICVGPHVQKTSELGHFKIIKEESSGAGVRRIRAILK